MLQRANIFKVNCCLKVHNPHSKLSLPILGKRMKFSLAVLSDFSQASMHWG